MKEAKGGVFSTSDFDLVKKALWFYKNDIINSDMVDLVVEKELAQIASLLHRLGRV